MQIAKLDATSAKLRERDSSIFNKVVAAISKHDTQHANILANELSEVRKMNKLVTQAKLALEQITLRLNTVQELGDIVVTLSPAMGVIRNVRSGLVSVIPEAEHEIGEISGLLSSILVDAGQLGAGVINFESANEEADKILSEAGAVAEQRMRDKFPCRPENAVALSWRASVPLPPHLQHAGFDRDRDRRRCSGAVYGVSVRGVQ